MLLRDHEILIQNRKSVHVETEKEHKLPFRGNRMLISGDVTGLLI